MLLSNNRFTYIKEGSIIISDKFNIGFDYAIEQIFGGIVTSVLVDVVVSTGLIPSYFIWYFHLLNIAGMISLILAMPLWATSYIVGWLVGVFIMAYSELLTIGEITVYIIPIVILILRFLKYFEII